MTITGDPPIDVQADAEDRLTRSAPTLRVRPGIPVDRWLQIAGAALPLIGLVLIAAAWYGVSHTAREWRQTPYLVSGGLLDRKSTRLNSSHSQISYAVFCLKKKKK